MDICISNEVILITAVIVGVVLGLKFIFGFIGRIIELKVLKQVIDEIAEIGNELMEMWKEDL